MTPLARRIAREITLPVHRREEDDYADLAHKMDDVHCFDVTEVFDLITSYAWRIYDGEDTADLAFLPARKTWIEGARHVDGFGMWTQGFLLIESSDGGSADVYRAIQRGGSGSPLYFESFKLDGRLNFFRAEGVRGPAWECGASDFMDSYADGDTPGEVASSDYVWLHAALAIINSPRVFGRRQHMPNRTLERQLMSKRRAVGKFPLHAWTEITLPVGKPRDASVEEPVEAHLTGNKALHYCRAHLRCRLGKLELVRGHWRGDAALGIKQSRYKLTA